MHVVAVVAGELSVLGVNVQKAPCHILEETVCNDMSNFVSHPMCECMLFSKTECVALRNCVYM